MQFLRVYYNTSHLISILISMYVNELNKFKPNKTNRNITLHSRVNDIILRDQVVFAFMGIILRISYI
jgi:hypothetical protein